MSPPLAFGDFLIDVQQRRLVRQGTGEVLAITPRVFDLLLALIDRAPEVVSREELLSQVWPGLVVEDNNLSQHLSILRRLLGDEAESPRYIQTVPRRGLRFIAELRPSIDPAPVAAQTPRRKALLLAGLGGGLGVGALLWWKLARVGEGRPDRIRSLSVLPFKPLVEGSSNPVLEIGLADALITRLGRLKDLRVTAIASSRRYSDPQQDPLAAAQALDTDSVLDGTLQRQGDRLRVTVRLLRRADGASLWSASFDEQAGDLFALQERIAQQVANSLQRELGLPPRSFGRGGQAQELYMAGRLNIITIKPAHVRRGIELFQRAIELDPEHALAHSGLAEAWRRLPVTEDSPPQQAFATARRYALRALELEPELAEAHVALGWVYLWHDFDWPKAEASFRRGIALNPSLVEGYTAYGHLLSHLARPEQAVEQLQLARQVDPQSLVAIFLMACFLVPLGRLDEAQRYVDLALNIDPQFWNAYFAQGLISSARRDPAAAIAALRKGLTLTDSSQISSSLAWLLAKTGQVPEARRMLAEMMQRQQAGRMLPSSLGLVHLGLGEEDQAMQWLQEARRVGDPRVSFLRVDPRWWALRRRADFMQLYEGLKLPPLPQPEAAAKPG
ncbi:winged helix-turn-helix domain-containing protein [Pelomonas sp. SE-A7]|uniref:winged helix-turn-helix domain-containing protein n=1 Tax=Pelomonas sp. SE-A7 TaxID=3054953 RepID=UPI00259D13CE|nr:winged helix-turn-helix domain-containing protein [Pelomonas sp. SE-A7]MDM4767684.1 winged helix-turn-helix domain-containing protein [Pelomonas sp. SE-A7]